MNRKEFLLISLGIFLTVIAWVVADIYHATVREQVKIKISSPTVTTYTIDRDIINALKKKTE